MKQERAREETVQQATMFETLDIFHGHLSTITDTSHGKEKRSTFQLLNHAIDESLCHLDTAGRIVEASIPEPTPIDKQGIQIVCDIKLGSVWNTNDSDVEILRQIFSSSKEADQCGSMNFDRSIGGSSITGSSFLIDSSNHKKDVVATKDTSKADSYKTQEQRDHAVRTGALYKPEMWNERFQELLEYREKYQNVLVPHNWIGNKPLAQWVKRQRYQYKLRCEGKHNTLTSERMTALNEIGFVWSSHNAAWEERFLDLVQFTESHGHSNVPSNYMDSQLAVWVRSQRRQYKALVRGVKRSNMTEERFQKLKSLGFGFNPRNLKV